MGGGGGGGGGERGGRVAHSFMSSCIFFFMVTLSILGKIFSRRYIEIFIFYFSQRTGFDIS